MRKALILTIFVAFLAACTAGIITHCSAPEKETVYTGVAPAIFAQQQAKKDRYNDSVAYQRYYAERLAKDSLAAAKDAQIKAWEQRYGILKKKADQKVQNYYTAPSLANCDSALTARNNQVDSLEKGYDKLHSRLADADEKQCSTDEELKRNRLVIGMQNDNLKRATDKNVELAKKLDPVFSLGLGVTPGFDIFTGRPGITVGPNLNFNIFAFKRRKVVDRVQ